MLACGCEGPGLLAQFFFVAVSSVVVATLVAVLLRRRLHGEVAGRRDGPLPSWWSEAPVQRAPDCPFCKDDVAPDPLEGTIRCPSCHVAHHARCWTDHGGCTIFGCSECPTSVRRPANDELVKLSDRS